MVARPSSRAAARRRASFIRKDQDLQDARQVAGQGQRTVLEDPFLAAGLCRTDQLLAADDDFRARGDLKTNRVSVGTLRGSAALLHFSRQAKPVQGLQEGQCQAVVGFQNRTGQALFVGWGSDRIGEFIRVQDGPPSGRTAHQVPAMGLQPGQVHIGQGLGISQGEAGWFPSV